MDEKSTEDKDLYVFKAPSAGNETEAQDETGAIVGAVAACLIISAVLLFLWKILQRKKSEIQETIKDVEKPIPGLQSSNTNKNDKQKNKNISFRQSSSWKKIELPNSTMGGEEEFDAVDGEVLNTEMILPPASPCPSSTWSLQDEMISSDTGYNSGFCRKDGALRRRFKQGPEELYMEHPRDILFSLKRDRQAIRKEREKRVSRIKNAIVLLGECQKLIQKSKEKISVCSKEKLETLEKMRKSRKERKLIEMRRKQWKKWNSSQQNDYDKKEAFVAMQEWFDGLHLHLSVKQIAEEIFLLRSFHRTDIERNDFEKQSVCDSTMFLESCIDDVKKTRKDIRSWRKEFFDSSSEDNEAGKVLTEETEKYETRQRIMLSRIFTKKSVRPDQSDTNSVNGESSGSGEDRNFCQTCQKQVCFCGKTISLTTNPFTNFNSYAGNMVENNRHNTKTLSTFTLAEAADNPPDAQVNTEQIESFRLSPSTHLLTLKLREIVPPGAKERTVLDELSTREVEKALRRVPSILTLTSVKNDGKNTWTVVAEATTNRVANIRFNCRGKSYIIGMS